MEINSCVKVDSEKQERHLYMSRTSMREVKLSDEKLLQRFGANFARGL